MVDLEWALLAVAGGYLLRAAARPALVLPADRARPMVTVLDGHPHTLAFLASVNRVPSRNLGVTRFGQAGDLADVYRYHGIDADSLVRAGLDLIEGGVAD